MSYWTVYASEMYGLGTLVVPNPIFYFSEVMLLLVAGLCLTSLQLFSVQFCFLSRNELRLGYSYMLVVSRFCFQCIWVVFCNEL